MMKQCPGRLTWLARIVVLGGILLLATRVDVPTWTVGDSSVSGRLAAFASCVLPATADSPPSTPAGGPATLTPDCEASMPDRAATVRMMC